MTAFTDIDPFFDEDFAVAATMDSGAATVEVMVIFDAEAKFLGDDAVISTAPKITVRSEDVAGVNKTWKFTVAGTEYTVFEMLPDREGIREIYLEVV